MDKKRKADALVSTAGRLPSVGQESRRTLAQSRRRAVPLFSGLVWLLLGAGFVAPVAAVETLDMLRAIQYGASSTVKPNGTFSTALCVAVTETTPRDYLVVASFSQETTGSAVVSATVDYRLAATDGVDTTYSTVGQRFLDGGNDLGNGTIAWIFDNVTGQAGSACDATGTRFLLEHADDNSARAISTSRITLLAIPLDTSPNNVSMDWARVTQGNTTTFSTTSTSFSPVTGMAAEVTIDNANAPRGAYVVATLSSATTAIVGGGASFGEWTMQGSADSTNGSDGTWVDLGSQIHRSMSRVDESGMISLTAIVEGLDAGTYYFRIASLTQDAAEPVVTKRAQLAAVSLVYDGAGGGYFPWFNDTYVSGECDATNNNSPESLDGVIAASVLGNTICDDSGTPSPLTDSFALNQASDVFMTFVLNSNTTQSGNGDVGTFEGEVWSGHPTQGGTAVFGNDQNGDSNEVQRAFSGNTDEGSMGQFALWDSGDIDNAAGDYNAYGGWSITGNTLETFEATIVGWVGASADATRAFVTRLDAAFHDGQTVVTWDTVAERGTIGFRLQRLDDESGLWIQVTGDLVPGLLNAPQGGSYHVADSSAEPGGTYTYLLEEQDVRGINRYGPFQVTVRDGGAAATPLANGVAYNRIARPVKLRASRSAPKRKAGTRNPKARFTDARYRISVDQPGIQFVDASTLATLSGQSWRAVQRDLRSRRLRLTHQGDEVAYLPLDNGLAFYAEGLETRYTATDVFWLEPGSGTRMIDAPRKGGARVKAGTVPGIFTDRVRYDRDEFAAPGWVRDADHDFWFWRFLLGDIRGADTASIDVPAPGAEDVGENAELRLFLYGLSDRSAGPDHHLALEINDHEVADVLWDGLGPQNAALRFAQAGNLKDGDNRFVLRALLDLDVNRSWAYLDAVELTYSRRYEVVDDSLLLRGDDNEDVTVIGFSDRNVVVLDVADPLRPRHVRHLAFAEVGDGYAVTFKPDGPTTPYILASRSGYREPEVSVRGAEPDLIGRISGAEYLVLAPTDLLDAAQSLANHRQAQGLSALALDVQHVYDQFSGGVLDPSAIIGFLRHAYQEWATPPRYVTLMGRGTQDPRNILELEDHRIPTTWIGTPLGLAPTDVPYADLVPGDRGAWEVATSRLPVVDAAEAEAVVAKIIEYERATPLQSILLSADNDPEGIADFTTFSEKLIPGFGDAFAINRVHMTDPPAGASHTQDLKDRLQQGQLFWHWAGHGAHDRFATEPLLQSADVIDLGNGSRLPVLASTTCLVNQFDLPGNPSIGERLVASPDGGVLASFSPASTSITGQGAIMTYAFRDALLQDGPVRVGDAAKAAVNAYAERGFLNYIAGGFVLLGDSASLINK